ncbi:LacI family DNA-binding transcriptional regulator [Kineococcus sp. SYSU DK003]|uniref:LacI family DNA-binding transcriptional regulator n=1 Tax=Kineococcus sp. SYSU DK003 TaxID=3383124 RepID=UPI003D7E0C3D
MSGGTIGLVIPGPAHRIGVEPYFVELVEGMEQVLHPAGYSVLVLVVADLPSELATYQRWSAGEEVRAVVVVDLVQGDVRPQFLADLGMPHVLAAHLESPWACTSEVADDAARLARAVEFLAESGHRRLGHVCGPAHLVHTAERRVAIAASAARLDVQVLTAEADYTAAAGVQAVTELLAAAGPPTAVVFDNDVMAVAALEHLTARGVRVPGDVSLMSADDSPLCEVSVPPLSAMTVDVHHRGQRLGAAVQAVLAGGDARQPPSPESHVVVRGSTAARATSGSLAAESIG